MQHTVTLRPVHTATSARRGSDSPVHTRASAQPWILRHQSALATGAIVVLILAAMVVAVISLVARPSSPAPTGWAQVTVEPNASLWALASAHPVPGLRTSQTVALIAEENDLTSGVIHPGQTIRVPSVGVADTAVALR